VTIYTGRGDDGDTDLRDMSRVSKSSHRIEAYGTVDEANALIGTVRPTGYDDLDALLATVQNHLHIVQADLANPDPTPTIRRSKPTTSRSSKTALTGSTRSSSRSGRSSFRAAASRAPGFITPER